MKTIFILSSIFCGILTAGQVGIGTQSPLASTALQVDSTVKGVLPPRMNNTQMLAIVSPATGLMMYNTDRNRFFGWDGSQWTQEVFAPSNTWDISGNSPNNIISIGTNDPTNFNIRTNNKLALSILSNGQVRVEGENLQEPRLIVASPMKNSKRPGISLSQSLGFGNNPPGGAPFIQTVLAKNTNLTGSVLGTYAFATNSADAKEGNSSGGMSYIMDSDVSGISFYVGGHPTTIDDRSKEAMIIASTHNVGIGVHVPKSKLQVEGGNIYINDSARGLIIKDPGGACHRITVANGGSLNVSAVIACP